MAITKNSTKCAKPKHRSRRVKATLPAKKTQYKRGEDVDFEELSHRITSGPYEGYKGRRIHADPDGTQVKVLLRINKRGTTVRVPTEIEIDESDLEEVDSGDMLEMVNVEGEEEEDEALKAFEQETWTCSKCNGTNTNEGSYCTNMIGGRVCNTVRPHTGEVLGWGGCFKQTPGWTCGACFVRNDISDVQCKACGEPSKTESTTSRTASISNTGTEQQSEDTSIDRIASLSISGAGKRRRLDPICETGGN